MAKAKSSSEQARAKQNPNFRQISAPPETSRDDVGTTAQAWFREGDRHLPALAGLAVETGLVLQRNVQLSMLSRHRRAISSNRFPSLSIARELNSRPGPERGFHRRCPMRTIRRSPRPFLFGSSWISPLNLPPSIGGWMKIHGWRFCERLNQTSHPVGAKCFRGSATSEPT